MGVLAKIFSLINAGQKTVLRALKRCHPVSLIHGQIGLVPHPNVVLKRLMYSVKRK